MATNPLPKRRLPALRARLYRLQQRLALTAPEAGALLGLVALLLAGAAVRHVQGQAEPVPPARYAALDTAFAAASAPADSVLLPAPVAEAQPSAAASGPAPQPGASGPARSAAVAEPPRIDLNTAPPRLLVQLPRIGPKLAERIVAYREAHGPFRRAEDVQRVKGIGPKTFARLGEYVYVEAE